MIFSPTNLPRWAHRFILALILASAHPLWAQDHALLIGIGRYQSPDAPLLLAPPNDVQAFRGLLTGHWGFQESQIRQMLDAQATRTAMLAAMEEWLVQSTRPGERVVFYFSGHGYAFPDTDGDEDDRYDEALLPYDAQPDSRHAILDDDIRRVLDRISDRQVLVVIDACFSGTMTRSGEKPAGAKTPNWPGRVVSARVGTAASPILRTPGGGNVIAWFASAAKQLAYEDQRDPRRIGSVFTRALKDGMDNGLADKSNDGQVSYAELLEFTRQRAKGFCSTVDHGCNPEGFSPMLEMDAAKLAFNVADFGRAAAQPTATATAVLAHDNTAKLELRIEPGRRVSLGQALHYRLRSEKAGRLLLFDVDAAGAMRPLFPNPLQAQADANRIRAGADLIVPDAYSGFSLIAREPLGKYTVVAVLVEDQAISAADLAQPAAPGADPADWLGRLRSRLDRVVYTADSHERPMQWSMLAADYEITP